MDNKCIPDSRLGSVTAARFFVSDLAVGHLEGSQAHHALRVLRLRAGDTVTLCDGRGLEADAVIATILGGTVVLQTGTPRANQSEPALKVTLYVALTREQRMDFAIQKATELGVAAIVPFVSARCTVKNGGKDERWRKIAESAAAQAGRGFIPAIAACVSFQEAVAMAAADPVALFCYEEPGGLSLQRALPDIPPASVSCVTGPEGGFDSREAEYAARHLTAITLGPRILRCETAPIAVLSALLFWSGDMG